MTCAHADQRKTHQNTLTRTNRAASFGTLSCSLNHRNRQNHPQNTGKTTNSLRSPEITKHRSGSTEKTIQPIIKNIQKTRRHDTRKNTVFYNNKQFRRRKKGGAALNSSRELAYLSTVSDVRELNCRVRNGSGWNLSAMAAESPKPSSRFERE